MNFDGHGATARQPADIPPPTTGPRVGSLFSGVAGLDGGVHAVIGGSTAWFCEVDPAASKVLATRFPGIPNLGDITAVDWTAVEPVDVLVGGFPCTDVSIAGTKAGLGQTRSGLWSHFLEAIEVIKPKLVIIENVRGLLSTKAFRQEEETDGADSDMGRGRSPVAQGKSRRRAKPVLTAAGAVIGQLSSAGYDAVWKVVPASDVGAPHHRARVFIVAWRRDIDPDTYREELQGWRVAAAGTHVGVGSLPAPLPRDGLLPTPVTTDARSAARHTTSTGVMHSGTTLTDAVRSLLPTPRATDGKKNTDNPGEWARKSPSLAAVSVHFPEAADAVRSLELLPTPTSADGKRGPDLARASRAGAGADDLVTFAVKTSRDNMWNKYAPAINRWEHIHGPAPYPTEPNSKGNPRISPLFTQWMMGVPNGWVTDIEGLSRTSVMVLLGNAVVPQQAAYAVAGLLDVIEAALDA